MYRAEIAALDRALAAPVQNMGTGFLNGIGDQRRRLGCGARGHPRHPIFSELEPSEKTYDCEQMNYAALDAYAGLRCYERLSVIPDCVKRRCRRWLETGGGDGEHLYRGAPGGPRGGAAAARCEEVPDVHGAHRLSGSGADGGILGSLLPSWRVRTWVCTVRARRHRVALPRSYRRGSQHLAAALPHYR